MAAIAAFALSDSGRMYDAVCARDGLDRGAIFPNDDLVAFNLRAALLVASQRAEPAEPVDDWEAAAAANRRAWREGARG